MADERPRRNPIVRNDYRGAVVAQPMAGVDPIISQHADWQTGNVDTSDTADLIQNQVEAVSPVFEIHRRNAAIQAARALDPHDPGVSRRAVVMPTDATALAEEARNGIYEAANYAVDNPVMIGGPNRYQLLAAQGDSSDLEQEEVDAPDAADAWPTDQDSPQG